MFLPDVQRWEAVAQLGGPGCLKQHWEAGLAARSSASQSLATDLGT